MQRESAQDEVDRDERFEVTEPRRQPRGISRRRMIGYLIAAPTLVAGARWLDPADEAKAAVPSPGITDLHDLSDVLTYAALPTMGLLKVTINPDGTAVVRAAALGDRPGHHDLDRRSSSPTSSTCRSSKVKVTLADARPELLCNQLTGASNTMHRAVRAAALRRRRPRAASSR